MFALGISRCCRHPKEELEEALSVWYLDDGTVVGSPKEVGKAWGVIQEEMRKVGLEVNKGKCEVWGLGREDVVEGLEGVPRVHLIQNSFPRDAVERVPPPGPLS